VAHVDLAGMGYLCLTTNDAKQQIPDIAVAGSDALHSIRIENATPWMGIDIDSSNLPQEILRDDQCISFTKGCYLGQETVARIDAIGRVNRVIVKIQSIKPIQVDDQLHYDEKPVGKVLSVSWSPDQNCFLALAMVRRPHEKSSTQLTCGDDTVSVV
jgi:folate-binding protein YgfZ